MGEHVPDASATLGCGTNVELPVTEIGYTYERMRGDVNGNGFINMDDLTAMINYLVFGSEIDMANSAICDNLDSTTVGMDDLTALINYLVFGHW